MPKLNVQEEMEKFGERLRNGYYATERSKNTEVNYAEKKEGRDTEAVKAFTKTEALFRRLSDPQILVQ